jgi:transposase
VPTSIIKAVMSVVITVVAGAPTNEACESAFCTAIAAAPSMPAATAVGAAGSRPEPSITRTARKHTSRTSCSVGRGAARRGVLPKHLKAQIRRELNRLEILLEQIKAVEVERDALLAAKETSAPSPAAILLNIKGIGPEFAAVLWSEGLFRHFDNRRQVAAYAGLAPTPWQSGAINREQGVSKSDIHVCEQH